MTEATVASSQLPPGEVFDEEGAASSSWRVRDFTLVGCGSSSSTPMLQCLASTRGAGCAVCRDAMTVTRDDRDDGLPPRFTSPNHRLNPSALVVFERVAEGSRDAAPAATTAARSDVRYVLIDCGKTFRESAIKVLIPAGVPALDAIILTHDHMDAIGGLDDVRDFCDAANRGPVRVYCNARTLSSLRRLYPYLFPDATRAKGAFLASLQFIEVAFSDEGPSHFTLDFGWTPFGGPTAPRDLAHVTSLPLEHGPGYICHGFAFDIHHSTIASSALVDTSPSGVLAYLSDVSRVPLPTQEYLLGLGTRLRILVLDMLGERPYFSHFSVSEAIAFAKFVTPPRRGGRRGRPDTTTSQLHVDDAVDVYFVGMSHHLDYAATNRRLAAAWRDHIIGATSPFGDLEGSSDGGMADAAEEDDVVATSGGGFALGYDGLVCYATRPGGGIKTGAGSGVCSRVACHGTSSTRVTL